MIICHLLWCMCDTQMRKLTFCSVPRIFLFTFFPLHSLPWGLHYNNLSNLLLQIEIELMRNAFSCVMLLTWFTFSCSFYFWKRDADGKWVGRIVGILNETQIFRIRIWGWFCRNFLKSCPYNTILHGYLGIEPN